MLHRLISYGFALGLGTMALAVLLFAARPDTNDAESTAELWPAVLGDQTTPNSGPTAINEGPPAICPNTEFVAQAGDPHTAPIPAEPTATAPVGPPPTPCIHAVAWAASPVP